MVVRRIRFVLVLLNEKDSISSLPGVNLTTEDSLGQLDAYVQNGEWDLEGRCDEVVGLICIFFLWSTAFVVARQAVVYECCPTVYPFILFTIQIRRRTLYYVVNVVGKVEER